MDRPLGGREPWYVVRPPREIDLETSSALRSALSLAVAQSRRVAVDLADVAFMGSIGVGLLVQARQRQHARGGQLVLRHPSGAVTRVLRAVGAGDLLEEPADRGARLSA